MSIITEDMPNGVPIEDRLILFGYGLFETIRIEKQGPTCLERHYNRMQHGALRFGLKIPSFSVWMDAVNSYLAQNPHPAPFALRITLTGGTPELPSRLLFHIRPIPYTPSHYAKGVAVQFLSTPKNESSPLCSYKTTNYLENILGREEARSAGFFEGLWWNTKGFIAEGTMSNIFFTRAGELYTPALVCGCLPGTRRALILELASSLGIPIHEGEFTPADLEHADAIFLTNALMGIMPVRQLGALDFSSSLRSKTSLVNLLQQALNRSLKIV